jgi:hypothetical protein
MTRHVLLLTTGLLLAGVTVARAGDTRTYSAPGAFPASCPNGQACEECGPSSPYTGLLLTWGHKKREACKAAPTCEPPPSHLANPYTGLMVLYWQKDHESGKHCWDWLCYHPAHTPKDCCCRQLTPCCDPPLYTFFLCEGHKDLPRAAMAEECCGHGKCAGCCGK